MNTNIEKDTLKNNNYRKVVHTNKFQQIVLMSLIVGEDIPMESHNGSQFFRIEKGSGSAVIETPKGKKRVILRDGVVLVVPPNTRHSIKNTSKKTSLKLYSIYSPPQHPSKTINRRQPT